VPEVAADVPEDLSAEKLEAMLDELLEQYQAPAFQAELLRLQEAIVKSKSHISLLAAMGPVVLRVQVPILEKYGYPPNARGVELMKHAVGRRVAEGAERVEELANQARRALGIEAMPSRNFSAEEVMARKVDETSRKLGIGTPGAQAELQRQCRLRITAEREAGALPEASAAFLERLLAEARDGEGKDGQGAAAASGPSVLAILKMIKFGLTLPALWVEGVPSEAVPVLEAPTAREFFEAHVLPNRPAVLRGALDAQHFPPLRDFADMSFLRSRCGHRRVLVKSLGYGDQAGRPVFVSDPELKIPFAAFLDSVEAHEKAMAEGSASKVPFYLGKVPLQTELPELAEAIEQAETCPSRKYGSCFGKCIPQGVFTYFGCARNTTAVHFDAHDNLLVCISGWKRLFVYPPSDARYLYPCNDFTRSAVVPFANFEDLSEDLQAKYALMPRATPSEVLLKAGDLFYLPSCWWHCVEGSEDRNMILNWWFDLHPEKRAVTRAAGAECTSLGAVAA
jgi:hypothetical protein